MSSNISPLGALKAFEAAARHASFVRASEELAVTPAAISHQIKLLERWLRVPLFVRAAQGVALTPAGRDYSLRTREAFATLMAASQVTRANRKRSVVTIRAQFSFASMWLMPCLAALQAERPDIDISLLALPERYDAKLSSDLLIYEYPRASGYVGEVLIGGHFMMFAAPALLAKTPDTSPLGLLSQRLVHTRTSGRLRNPTANDWFQAAGLEAPPSLPGMQLNLMHMAADACAMGCGFALLIDAFCSSQVAAGRLQAIAGPSIASPHPVFSHLRAEASDDAKAVHTWLQRRANNRPVNS